MTTCTASSPLSTAPMALSRLLSWRAKSTSPASTNRAKGWPGRAARTVKAARVMSAGVGAVLAEFLGDRAEAEHVAGEVLIVIALDIVGVHRRGGGVAERHAGDGADLPAPVLLELVEQGRHEPAVLGDVEAVVERLDP